MSVIDNVKVALHHEIRYSLAESILHLFSYSKKEKETTKKAMEILKVFDLDVYADVLHPIFLWKQRKFWRLPAALDRNPKLHSRMRRLQE